MLNDYKDKQEVAYNLIYNDIVNKCVTHAYLIDENSFLDSFGFVMSFVKAIICSLHDDVKEYEDCILCRRINDGNYPEVKVISPDGNYIKKNQIIELQKDFSRTAVEGKKRIYIIRDCEKMRPEAANSMLKFLEEPDTDIVAILMTNNFNNVLSTIISRCKIVKLNNLSINDFNVDDDIINLGLNFISCIESNGRGAIVDARELLADIINSKDRDKLLKIFDVLIDIYYDILKVITGSNELKYVLYIDKIRKLAKFNKLDIVIRKIEILIESKDSIKFNVNSNLLVDSVIVGIGGVVDDSRN